MKLNLGCGYNKLDGYLNVDQDTTCKPDLVLSLDRDRWPWADSSVDEVLLVHVLEHLGETTEKYFHFIKELYRVCNHGAVVKINVPHPRHDNFLADPTHVRPILPLGLSLLDKQRNRLDLERNGRESKLGLMLDVNFVIEQVEYLADGEIQMQIQNNKISQQDLDRLLKFQNNICEEIYILWRVIKL